MKSKDIDITIRTRSEGRGFENLLSQLKSVQKETKLTAAQLAELGKNASASSAYFGGSQGSSLLLKAFQQSLSIAQSISTLLGGGANEVLSAFRQALNLTMSIIETVKTINSLISIFSFLGFAGGGAYQARQHGGPVFAGMPYKVGERGEEVLVPYTNGFIISNDQLNSLMAGATRPSITAHSDTYIRTDVDFIKFYRETFPKYQNDLKFRKI